MGCSSSIEVQDDTLQKQNTTVGIQFPNEPEQQEKRTFQARQERNFNEDVVNLDENKIKRETKKATKKQF